MYPWQYTIEDFTPRLGDASNAKPYAEFLKTYKGTQLPIKEDCYNGVCKYRCGYLEYPQYPVNRYYIRSPAPFLQEIGWAFWDTEDDTDRRPHSDIQVATNPTPTHKPVAESFTIEPHPWTTEMPNGDVWDYTPKEVRTGGKKTVYDWVRSMSEMNYKLWKHQRCLVLKQVVQKCLIAVQLLMSMLKNLMFMIFIGLTVTCVS